MPTLLEQIQTAFEQSGMTLEELLEKSGLDMHRINLGKRMRGAVPLRTDEAEALASAMGTRLVWNAPGRRVARRAA